MNRRHVVVLALVATLAVLAALWSGRTGDNDARGTAGEIILPGLDETLNDVSSVRLDAGADTTLTLERGERAWIVREKDGYPADAAKVRAFLIDLANAAVIEEKTTNPDNYAQLGLAEPGAEDGGVRVEVTVPDRDAYVLIAGNTSRGGDAAYVRRPDEMQTWLVSGDLEVETDPISWLDTGIADIPATRVQSVRVRHADGETLEISKASRDAANFTVAKVPAGRRMQYDSAANPLGAALSALRLEDVRAFDAAALDEAATVETEFRTFDGLVVTVRGNKDDTGGQVHIRSAFDEEQAMRFLEFPVAADEDETVEGSEGAREVATQASVDGDDGGDGAGDATGVDAQMSGAAPDFTAVREEAAAMDAKLAPWTFRIGSYKFDQMARRMDSITVAEEDE